MTSRPGTDSVGTNPVGDSQGVAPSEHSVSTGVLDTVDLPIVVVGRDCTLALFNRAAADAFNLAPSDRGRRACDIEALAVVTDCEQLCAQVIADEAPCRREIQLDDRRFLLRLAPYRTNTGQTEGAVLTFTNVTAFRASIEQAIYEREYTKAILNTVVDPMVVLDNDLRVETANRAFYSMFGASRENAQGVPLSDLGNNDWKALDLWASLKAILTDNTELHRLEIECDFAAVGRRTLLLDAHRLSRDGHAMILLVFRDITERKRIEEALKDASRRKDEFLATLAHELRNPLAPIRNAVELLRQGGDDAAVIDTVHRMMERQLGQMVRLIDDLLDVARITSGKLRLRKERVELASVVQSAVEETRPLIEAQSHQFSLAFPPGPVHLVADPTRLAQVFSNLLNNAAKYTEKGGHIWLTIERLEGEVSVSVRDTGIGIDVNALPHIFEMFSQAVPALERSQGGLGVGLALVRGLVELHGGSIDARSSGRGTGSEFIVRLPIVQMPFEEAPPEPVEPDARLRSSVKQRILVVDDSADAANSLAMVLRRIGHEIQTAHDGLQAVQTAAIFRPDVVLLDIGLPKMNGYEAAKLIKNQSRDGKIAIIAVSGWGQDEDKRRAFEAGFDHHLTKPVEPAALNRLLALIVPERHHP